MCTINYYYRCIPSLQFKKNCTKDEITIISTEIQQLVTYHILEAIRAIFPSDILGSGL